ncbi:DUF397 domain-containing protein [Saccharopolyspora phatthalungensis]|uniref:DUF397 domain-containing protein n=1 Tax=Saccharopolyspora phatthalungensis TaxID=664693 RepID=A0A840QKX2_9PSEU|nr:DUF397 domain-containing protein [Saccharopolyspora phatthalungensis]MBB5159733.1 hypothetical protein [Saccharopolyspora phatthalungensis]
MDRKYWIKSTYSNVNGNCIELAVTLDHIRDSKDPHGPALRGDVATFVRAVKTGRFDQ